MAELETEDDTTDGPRDFLGKPGYAPLKNESVTEAMARALVEGSSYLHVIRDRTTGVYRLVHSSLDDPKHGGGQEIAHGGEKEMQALAVRLKKPGDEIKVWESVDEDMAATGASGGTSGMTTSGDIATVPLGFKVKKEDLPTPETTAETGIGLTGPGAHEESKRLPHLTAFLESFSGNGPATLQESTPNLGSKALNDLNSAVNVLASCHSTLEGWLDHARKNPGQLPPDFPQRLAKVTKALPGLSVAVAGLRG